MSIDNDGSTLNIEINYTYNISKYFAWKQNF